MARSQVLLLVDESSDLMSLTEPFERAGLVVDCRHDVEELASIPVEQFPDVLVLEWQLVSPQDSSRALTHYRALKTGVLAVLSPLDLATYDFTQGADDFVLAPASAAELLVRLRQLLWKTRGVDNQQALRRGDLIIDRDRYEVTLGGRRVFLTFKEYQLLELLASNPGRVYTRDTLLSQVWGYDYFGGTRTVDVHIRRLRSKIEDAGHTFIETMRNVGYRFRPEV